MVQLAGKEVGKIGFGLMGFTWRPQPCPEEQAFEAMRAALAAGCAFWNGGEIYGTPAYNSMTLLERYFAKYPEDADKVVLSIKGGLELKTLTPDSSPESLRRSVDNIVAGLKGRKSVEMFECARRDARRPLEETFGILNKEYVGTGKIGGISLSEVSAATIHEAVKITKVVAVEVELSLWSTDPLENGVAAACAQYDIPLVAYSPLGRGPENFDVNLELVRQLEALAAKKGCKPSQLAIGWVIGVARRPGMPVIIPIPGATTAERVRENATVVELTDAEMAEIDAVLAKFDVAGGRYPDGAPTNT